VESPQSFPGNADLLIGIGATFGEDANQEIGDPGEDRPELPLAANPL